MINRGSLPRAEGIHGNGEAVVPAAPSPNGATPRRLTLRGAELSGAGPALSDGVRAWPGPRLPGLLCASGPPGAWPHPGICVLVLSRPQRDASVEVSTGHLLRLPCHPPPPALASLRVGDPPPPAPGAVPRVAFPRPSAESHSSGSRHGWEASSSPGVVAPGPGSDAHLALPPVTPAHTAAPLQASSTLKGAAVPSRLFFSLLEYYLKFTHFPMEGPFSCKHQILPLPASPFLSDLLSYP